MGAIEFITQRLGAPNPSDGTPLATLLADEIVAVRASEARLRARLDAYRI